MSRNYSPEGGFYNLDKTLDSKFYCLKSRSGDLKNPIFGSKNWKQAFRQSDFKVPFS